MFIFVKYEKYFDLLGGLIVFFKKYKAQIIRKIVLFLKKYSIFFKILFIYF